MPIDTAPIRPEEQFDGDRVAAYLRETVPEIVGDHDITFEQFPGGKANLTFIARAGDVDLVLRRPPLGPVAPGAHDMRREYKVLSVLHEVYPAAPRAIALCEDEGVMGKTFFVMERRRGHVIRGEWPPELASSDDVRRRIAVNLVDGLADLHGVDYVAIGLHDLGRPDGFVERQVSGFVKRWALAKHQDVAEMEELGRRLSTVPRPQTATLIHNDYKLDNVMIGRDGSLVAVFDWDMSTTGDPLVDLGTALVYWTDPTDAVWPAFEGQMCSLTPWMDRREVVERYAARTGFDVAGVEWYHAFAIFRIAVIIQQIYIRYHRGHTSDQRFARMGGVVPLMAVAALELLE